MVLVRTSHYYLSLGIPGVLGHYPEMRTVLWKKKLSQRVFVASWERGKLPARKPAGVLYALEMHCPAPPQWGLSRTLRGLVEINEMGYQVSSQRFEEFNVS